MKKTDFFASPYSWLHRLSHLAVVSAMAVFVLFGTLECSAMQSMGDEDLSDVSGSGLAIALNNISVKMDKTSYVELTGVDLTSAQQRALRMDLRWYGMSYTSSTGATDWAGNGCAAGILNLGCPIGGTIANLAAFDNPLILRSYNYSKPDMSIAGTVVNRSVLEFLFPSRVGNGSLAVNDVNQYIGAHDPYRFAFWGELNVGTGNAGGSGTALTRTAPAAAVSGVGTGSSSLKVLNIWNKVDQSGSAYRFFQTTGATPTLGLQVINNFAADIRMSVAQNSASAYGVAPDFNDTEGLYMRDFRLHMPTGQLNYQALQMDSITPFGGGSPVLYLTLNDVPNVASTYDLFYGRTAASDSTGPNANGYTRSVWSGNAANLTNYNLSHGFLRMGDFAPTQRTKDTTATGYNAANGNQYISGTGAPDGLNCVTAACRTNQVTRLLKSEVSACVSDRPGCAAGGNANQGPSGNLSGANGNNGQFDQTDGLFFVGTSAFTVIRTSPNYTSWSGANTASRTNDPMADANNPAIFTIPNSGIYTRDTIAAGTAINLGDVNISGLMIHNLTVKAL